MNNKLLKLNISSDYELEFRIEDIEFIKSILKKPNIKPVSFEDAIITTYDPVISCPKYVYRSSHILNSISSDKYERKELIYKDSFKLNLPIIEEYSDDVSKVSSIPNPLVYPSERTKSFKDITIITKYSRETPLSNIAQLNSIGSRIFDDLKINNVYRKLRITYKLPDLNFKIDLTSRYFPIMLKSASDATMKACRESMERYVFKPEQVLQFENIDGYVLKTDMEFEYLSDSESSFINEYNKLVCFLSNYDHITFSKLKRLIPFDFTKSPQVNILTNQIINSPNSWEDFVWSEKMDGVRYLLIVYNDSIYTWQNIEQLKYLTHVPVISESQTPNSLYIFDCEKIDNAFYIFDCYVDNFNDIRHEDYISRLKHAETFINTHFKGDSKYSIELLNIHRIDNWNDIINYALSKHANTDGIVLHTLSGINVNAWPKVNLAYKLKPTHLNTVDFLYKYIPSHDEYQLYLSSNYQTFTHALRSKSINDKISQELFNYDLDKQNNATFFILFDCPYFENMWKYRLNPQDLVDLNVKDSVGTCDSSSNLNNLIIESQYLVDEKRWKPIRIRYDKEYPNNYNVGLTNVSLIFDPPHFTADYHWNSTFGSKIDIPQQIVSVIRTYVWDYITINASKLLPFSKSPIVMIDYMCNPDDIINYYTSNITKIFAVSDSKTTLVNYVNTLKDSYSLYNSHKHIITILNQIKHPRIYLNVLNSDSLSTDLVNSNDFVLNEINLIFINSFNFDLDPMEQFERIYESDICQYCNTDAVIVFIYVGNCFEAFYDKYGSKVLHVFHPTSNDYLEPYLINLGITKAEINKYDALIHCAILKL